VREILKKERYTNEDFDQFYNGDNKLNDVQTELLNLIDLVKERDATESLDKYGKERLGVVVFKNKYIDIEAKNIAEEDLQKFVDDGKSIDLLNVNTRLRHVITYKNDDKYLKIWRSITIY